MKIIHFNSFKRNYNISSSTIITVHRKDKWVLKRYCKKNKIVPYKVYTLFNYPIGLEEVVAYYLKHKFYPQFKIDLNTELLTVWNIILNNFNQYNFVSVLPLVNKLNSIEVLLDLKILKKDLNFIIYSFLIPFYEKGLFLDKDYSEKKQRSNENAFSDYYSLRDKLNNLNGSTRLLQIDNYINSLKALFPSHNDSLENKYFFISIYFYNIALYYYKNKNYTVCFNMLHRVIDIYFDYLCKVDSLHPSKNFLWNKYEELASSRSSYTFSTDEENLIKELNQSRNKLYLTHDLYSIKKSEALKMIKKLKQLIKSKTGNLWEQYLNKITFEYKLKPIDLFKSEPSFQTYFKDSSNEFLL